MSIHSIRKRFVKNYKLQIPVLQSPYFEYYLELYDKKFNTLKLYNNFISEVEKFKNEEEYLEYSNSLTNKIVKHITSKESYSKFNTESIDQFNIPQHNIPKKDIFNIANENKFFISIDLIKANFNAIKYYDKDIVDTKDTYEEFISQFTDLNHIIESKYIRQVIFGKLNPKRISKVEYFITYQILKDLLEVFDEKDIKFFSHDEIVLEFSNETEVINKVLYSINEIIQKINIPVRVEAFKLLSQEPHEKLGFIKQKIGYYDFYSSVEFKCVSDIFFAQAYKKRYNLEINDNDLMFYHEGQLCKFLNKI